MTKEQIKKLAQKIRDNKATDKERAEFFGELNTTLNNLVNDLKTA